MNHLTFSGIAGDVKLGRNPSKPSQTQLRLRISTNDGTFPVVINQPTDSQQSIQNGHRVSGTGHVRTTYARLDTFTAANVVVISTDIHTKWN